MTKTTENTEKTAQLPSFWQFFKTKWSKCSTKKKVWTVIGILFLIWFLYEGATHDTTTNVYVVDKEGSLVVEQGEGQSKQSNLQNLYYDVVSQAASFQRSRGRFESCQTQYPPEKYGDVCSAKSFAYEQSKLKDKVDAYNRQAKAMTPDERVGFPPAFDENGKPISN